ncbi:hypothetical protein NMG60_11032005 [Bertholletia excelsa]
MSAVRAVLLDAEKQQMSNHLLKDWLGKLKYAFYDADIVLDEFQIEAWQREVESIPGKPWDTASSRMQIGEFGKSEGLWKTLAEGTWSEAFDGLGISLLLTSNPSI